MSGKNTKFCQNVTIIFLNSFVSPKKSLEKVFAWAEKFLEKMSLSTAKCLDKNSPSALMKIGQVPR